MLSSSSGSLRYVSEVAPSRFGYFSDLAGRHYRLHGPRIEFLKDGSYALTTIGYNAEVLGEPSLPGGMVLSHYDPSNNLISSTQLTKDGMPSYDVPRWRQRRGARLSKGWGE